MVEPQGQSCAIDFTTTRRTTPTPLGATVKGSPWVVDPDRMQLFDPADVVIWDLKSLWAEIPRIKQVTLKFLSGMKGWTTNGPFKTVAVDLVQQIAVGVLPDDVQDCYQYDIEVTDELGQKWDLFPIDPQIDNLPPIPPRPPHPEPPPRRRKRTRRP